MNAKQQNILDSILASVLQQGWTEEAFVSGSRGASPADLKKFFPRGIVDVAAAYHAAINQAMLERIKAKRNFPALRVRDKITFAVRARLEAIADTREAMRRLLVWSMLPRNIRAATRELWKAADAIWLAAGDEATDYNYYTKRLLLITVMKSVLAFWLNDESKNYQDTWDFLDRRIADVMAVGKGMSVIKTVGVADIVSFVRGRFAG